MAHILITHGTGGSPEGNWFPWLAADLRRRGHTVQVPRYPTPQGQGLQPWLEVFEKEVGWSACTSETILVGHSLGAAFNLRLLERLPVPVKASFLLAGFLGRIGLPEYDQLNASFLAEPFDWPRIRKNIGRARIYHGDNDPYVALAKAHELAEKIEGAALLVIPGGGHLNAESGYSKLELLLNDLLLVIKGVR